MKSLITYVFIILTCSLSSCGAGEVSMNGMLPEDSNIGVNPIGGGDGRGTGGTRDIPVGETLYGSIVSSSGIQSYLQGWVLALMDRDTGTATTAIIDNAGLFQLEHVDLDRTYTIVLLSPDYIVESVIVTPGPVPGTVRQFFIIESETLPRLIHKGQTVQLQSSGGISFTDELASDANGDLIPDGMEHFGTRLLVENDVKGPSSVDLDVDGVPNHLDPDIDGDGVINRFDPDDDGDIVYDLFDIDADGDLVDDTVPGGGSLDGYFDRGLVFFAIQYMSEPDPVSVANHQYFRFNARVRGDISSEAVRIVGAPALLNGAQLMVTRGGVSRETGLWNGMLFDDGLHDDGSANDGVYGAKVTLGWGSAPRSNEVIFCRLVINQESNWVMDFPYTFPDLHLQTNFKTTLDPISKTVGLGGNPFRTFQDFLWSISVFRSDGYIVWMSQPIPGTNRSFRIPENVFAEGHSYSYNVVARTLDKIPGYPAISVGSRMQPINR